MRFLPQRIAGRLLLTSLFGMALFLAAARAVPAGGEGKANRPLRARAVIHGGLNHSSIEGVVTFRQRECPGCPTPGLAAPATDPGFRNFPEPTVDIVARIGGATTDLTPGAHGMHIHETGVCDPDVSFLTAGSHYDPGPYGNGTPVDANHPFHMGDIPNLIVNRHGDGFLQHTTSRVTLSPSPITVFDLDGSAVVVHLNPDRGIPGALGASGGPRIACGVIELVSDDDDDDEEDRDR